MANPYTWQIPVTSRSSGSERMTYEDMTRITENLAWLYTECVERGISISGSIISQTAWTRNDIITVSFWAELLDCLANVCAAVSYTPQTTANSQMAYTNINIVETIERDTYEILSAYDRQPNMNHYVGDKIGTNWRYCGDGFNMGGRYE